MLTLENLSLFYEQDKKVLDDINLIVANVYFLPERAEAENLLL